MTYPEQLALDANRISNEALDAKMRGDLKTYQRLFAKAVIALLVSEQFKRGNGR